MAAVVLQKGAAHECERGWADRIQQEHFQEVDADNYLIRVMALFNIMLSAATRSIGRRCCRPWAASVPSTTAAVGIAVTPFTPSIPIIITVVSPTSSRALSTIGFDAAAYFSNSPSTPTTAAVGTTNNLAPTTSSVSLEHQLSRQQAEEQMTHWIENNPLIAPYKAEECLAKVWVAQQEIFDEWAAFIVVVFITPYSDYKRHG